MNESTALGIVLAIVLALLLFGIPFRIVCAWCQGDLGPSWGTSEDSHGICDDCAEDLVK